MSWEEAQQCYADREDWCQCVARSVFDMGQTKDQGSVHTKPTMDAGTI